MACTAAQGPVVILAETTATVWTEDQQGRISDNQEAQWRRALLARLASFAKQAVCVTSSKRTVSQRLYD